MIFKIRGEIQKNTNTTVNYVPKIVRLMSVAMHIIKLNNFIIQIDTKQNYYCSFAHGQDELKLTFILDKITHDQEFYMYYYKTVWCPQIEGHDRGNCVYAHNAQDFRRDPEKLIPIECQQWNKDLTIQRFEQGGCKDFENCQYCHGWKELEYHPHMYKTKPCTSQNCQKKQQECAFYHGDQDKRIKKILQDGSVQMQDCKKQQQGKQNGPIVATYRPQKEQNISKIHQGAPFDIFSQSKTKASESRKMSDISYEAMEKNKPKFQQQNQHKKTRTAPTTPDNRGQQKQKIMLEFGFSKRFASIISKQNQGQQILQTLQGLKIQEYTLIQMSDQQLNTLHLSGSQKNILINAISEIKAEKKFEEDSATQLLEETLEQQQF
ncbi:hypothetical protein pb186bvf_010186 [Paramecium bursaria]